MKNQPLNSKYLFNRLLIIIMGFALFFVAISCANKTAEETTEDAEALTEVVAKTPIEEGHEWYLSYCTMCHGEDGKGKGIMADDMKMPPYDLTTITLRRGEFSHELMAKIIAGVEEVPGHTTEDMPAWLETFKESENITDEAVLNEKIDHIVLYLESIQLTEWAGE